MVLTSRGLCALDELVVLPKLGVAHYQGGNPIDGIMAGWTGVYGRLIEKSIAYPKR